MTPREPTPPASLVEAQAFLARAFTRRDPVTADPEFVAASARLVAGNDRLGPAEQVDVYRRQFWLRHDDVLRDDFPGLHFALGDAAWDAFVLDYLEAHPPDSPSLRDLGARVLSFLEGWPGMPPAARALALEMARYELAFADVFDGAEPPPLSAERVAAIPPEAWGGARIVLSPLVRRLSFDHPVHLVRKALRGGEAPARPSPAPTFLALFRRDLVVRFEELDAVQFELLGALEGGSALVEACGVAARGKDEREAAAIASQVGEWFRRWAAWGLFADVVVP